MAWIDSLETLVYTALAMAFLGAYAVAAVCDRLVFDPIEEAIPFLPMDEDESGLRNS
ncbi:hypothetical protein Htur_4631 (plasmid) [Haloterrigena turkmenica DSM 5511]|uniref:Uncharacterized protein n=1 Tax=Haloterrigena turkmenica (strain ATCC 51198 / DSM 5511 / JCM 9101 / NCIMB 13204 / VKM B-1734 / 4k) TaxID=543526 RepID=D2S220_HALTV|nr:hypothetical protein [Haloterrigena turkmenica]ADB63417.1 hypothetical protein Htur_4631 [Haloterrigena turkmenica DSM 5511]